jgi:hypothetical protein
MFLRAKKAPKCPWQVYVASAMMEWRHARMQVRAWVREGGVPI